MKTVYKYPLKGKGINEVAMPVEAIVLHVDNQFGQAVMWALVDVNENGGTIDETRRIGVYGTGDAIGYLGEVGGTKLIHKIKRYINTFTIDEGAYVYHAFEMM